MSPTLRLLGLPDDARVVILHADDVGMCRGANRAFLELARAGRIDCGSVMVPCPWFPEIVREAAADPSLDLGVHLTLTSEWYGYRWGPVAVRSAASGLLDADGYFHRDCLALRRAVDPAAAEEEMRAQLDRALAAGIDATHLDTHMGAALVPELLPATLRIARDYRLPLLLPRDLSSYLSVLRMGEVEPGPYAEAVAELDAAGLPVLDRFAMTPGVPSEQAEAAYAGLVTPAQPGLTYVALHPNGPEDIADIQRDHPRAKPHWRTDELRLFGNGHCDAAIARAGVRRLGMRALRDLHRRAAP
ncbi:polysaccharide deacetylase family protein [Falsiroseomonas oryzae]|uniref:polysaccharide deacetylase family protein n=1 Tax=Falsiroseomonas oryzae TaxID=2766473 RepID=UPI0022EB2B04|nr:polysaccharide deacetylase family protein [Roseomonas sp. MO-31]